MAQRSGSGSVTISDVARAAGVSKTTASFVLTERPGMHFAPLTRQRVRDAASQLGYRRSGLAAALSVGRIYTVGLLSQVDPYHSDTASISPYSKDVIVALTCACARAGLRLTTILAHERGERCADDLADGRVDGMVISSLQDTELARALYATEFPVVSLGSGYAERHIAVDNGGGAQSAVHHFVALGHKSIAYVTYPDERAHSRSSVERQRGYEEAMRKHGLLPQVLSVDDAIGLLTVPAHERFTACFCMNDWLASVMLREARERGLSIPQDLSLIGFDNGIHAKLAYPSLTSVENPLDAQADAAISALQTLWRGEAFVPPAPLPTRLIVRDSTGPAPSLPKENL